MGPEGFSFSFCTRSLLRMLYIVRGVLSAEDRCTAPKLKQDAIALPCMTASNTEKSVPHQMGSRGMDLRRPSFLKDPQSEPVHPP